MQKKEKYLDNGWGHRLSVIELIFVFRYHLQDAYRTWLYIWVIRRVSYKK